MACVSFFKIRSFQATNVLRFGFLLILCVGASPVIAQQILSSAQQLRVDKVYKRLVRDIFPVAAGDIPCSVNEHRKGNPSGELNGAVGYTHVKRLLQNGQKNCAIELLRQLRPPARRSRDEYQHWLLNLSHLLRTTGQMDSAAAVVRQLETMHPLTPAIAGPLKYEQTVLFRKDIQFEKTLKVGQEGLKIARTTGDKRLKIAVLSEIGKTSRDIYRQQPAKYLPFFQEALSVARTLNDSVHLRTLYADLVYVYFMDDSVDVDRALDHFEKSLSYFNLPGNLGERYDLLDTFVTLLGYFPSETQKVIHMYKKLLPMAQKFESANDIRLIFSSLAMGYHSRNDFPTAVAYFDSAMRYDSPDWEKDHFYAYRAETAQAMGNLPLSNEYFRKALQEKERVYLRRNNQSMTQWETEFRTREKELQLEQQQRRQWLLWGIVVLVSSLLALAIYFFLKNRTQLRILARQNTVIEQQSEELRSLDKAKTRFFSNITHEFRTPLTLILSPLETLLQEQPRNHLLGMIHANANRLFSLINQLLDLSKMDAGALKPNIEKGNLASFIQWQVESFYDLAQSRGVKLLFINKLSPAAEACYDADKFSKIIANLLSNALKFTPKGGEVTVEAGDREVGEGTDSLPLVSCLFLKISDTGIGIPPAQLASVFDRFYQADSSARRSYEGSGIGLSLVKELVEVLKGDIRVESEVDKGSTFYLRFPVGAETWDVVEKQDIPLAGADYTITGAEDLSPAILSTGKKVPIILIVEDNADLRIYIAGLFTKGYRILMATDGKNGLSQALEYIPDLIITDWMMPEMDGVMMSRSLKNDARTAHVPVLMLTAKSAVGSRIEGFEGGTDDYIVKPFHAAELQLKVRNWVQRQERLRQRYTEQLSRPHENPPLPEVEADFMESIFNILDEHLSDGSFGVDALSKKLQLNRRTLQRKIGNLTHLSPNELIRNHRLRRALPLLKRGESIADVAFQVGFENPSYFTKCFKEIFGKKPSEIEEGSKS